MEETKKCPRYGRELPKSEFFGGYCKECKRAMNREYTQRKAKLRRVGNPKLAEFTPRELMEELRFRGYRGELTFEQKIKI